MDTETYTVVHYVVEARRDQRAWLVMTGSEDEAATWEAFKSFQGERFPRLQYRMVKRTAVVTDEVLELT
jgi:hypothetical protein